MDSLLNVLFTAALSYIGLGVLYGFCFAVVSVFYKDRKFVSSGKQSKIAVFIPGYKEDTIIYQVAKDALEQEYPSHRYDVIIIADSFGKDVLSKLRTLPLKVMEVHFEKSTKAKSLNQVMAQLGDVYDVAVVLDADNLMKADFLAKVNLAYQNGHQAIQGHRTAKNLDTKFARLDALSEEINNSIFRRGHWMLGLPSALIGSAMAFDYKMYREVMADIDVVSGFDKELEIQLLKRDIKVAFLNDAIVLDEKVQSSEIFEKQRTRWLAAQVNFAVKYFATGLWQLLSKGKVGLFDKALQFALLPRALSLIAMVFVAVVALLLGDMQAFWTSITLVALFIVSMMLAIPRAFYNRQMLGAIVSLPMAILSMLSGLLKMKKAKNSFIHTPHTHVTSESPKP